MVLDPWPWTLDPGPFLGPWSLILDTIDILGVLDILDILGGLDVLGVLDIFDILDILDVLDILGPESLFLDILGP